MAESLISASGHVISMLLLIVLLGSCPFASCSGVKGICVQELLVSFNTTAPSRKSFPALLAMLV